MAHKTLVGGTAYEIKGGKALVGGTAYDIKKGRTLVGGTGYDISFDNSILASDIAVGSSVYLLENGTPVEYLVVNKGIPSNSSLYDSSCDGLWLLRKDIAAKEQWYSEATGIFYDDSTITTYLNSTILGRFNADTKNAIKSVTIPYIYSTSGSCNKGSHGLSTKVFLLGSQEVGLGAYTDGACLSYFNGATDSKRIANYNGTALRWWLRTATQDKGMIREVSSSGKLSSANMSLTSIGVRPALILPHTAMFDAETLLFAGVA